MRVLLLSCGVVMFLFGVYNLLVPRARYVSSNPSPGTVIVAPPSAVTVSFSDELAPGSDIAVSSTITLSPSGETIYSDGKKFASVGPHPSDPQRRTLRADLDPGLPAGLYWVQWKAVAAQGKAQRYGKFCFAVGMPVPEHITRDMPNALWERDYKWRGRRAALVGGLLLVTLGAVLPLLRKPA